MRASRAIALGLAVTFAAVGLVFLAAPGTVAALLEHVSGLLAIHALPDGDVEAGLFRVLAAAYMYLVAWLAWMTFRRPDEGVWPAALAQAKFASATLSVGLIVVQGPNLLLVTNTVVDGFLGVLALWLRRQAIARRPTARVGAP